MEKFDGKVLPSGAHRARISIPRGQNLRRCTHVSRLSSSRDPNHNYSTHKINVFTAKQCVKTAAFFTVMQSTLSVSNLCTNIAQVSQACGVNVVMSTKLKSKDSLEKKLEYHCLPKFQLDRKTVVFFFVPI